MWLVSGVNLVWSWFRSGLDLSYLWIVDNAAAAADSLTSCPVSVGWLACGAAEAAGLMPAQQSLTLQDTEKDLKGL